MRYLFIDTESSNCFHNVYKLCEIGYLLTDDSFAYEPRRKKDILINPGKGRDNRFYLKGRKGGRDLVLAHQEKEYFSSPTFDYQYDFMGFMLRLKDCMIFMWAAENDIQALLDQCARYNYEEYAFKAYDVQLLFKKAFPELKSKVSLERAMEILGLDKEGIVPHRPDDDSLMTLMVLKGIVEKTGKSIKELIEECPECEFDSIEFYAELKKRKQEKITHDKRSKALGPYNPELNALLDAGAPEGTPKEKTFAVSVSMKIHVEETLGKIKGWLNKGFFVKRNLNVKYLVYYDEAEKESLASRLNLDELQLISIEEFDALTKGE